MAATTEIAWSDATFNPWSGCLRVSPGCDRCYAASMAARWPWAGSWEPGAQRKRTSAAYWRQPLKWNAAAVASGVRKRVFCASMGDWADNAAPPQWRADLFALIAATPQLDWLLLTKRPQNIAGMLPADWGDGWPNVWIGCTGEDQREADRRISVLRAVPARVRFLSVEPLLGPVTLDLAGISWVIVGGESGPGARPMQPNWARDVRDQCAVAGVPFFFKQTGSNHAGWPTTVAGKGDEPAQWTKDLRVQQFPHAASCYRYDSPLA